MSEALINYFTLEHLAFGIGIAVIIHILSSSKYRIYLISFFIVSLWELYEFRQMPNYWINNIGNNIIDIIVGMIGVLVVSWILKIIKHNDAKAA